jgi:hypothetical protein
MLREYYEAFGTVTLKPCCNLNCKAHSKNNTAITLPRFKWNSQLLISVIKYFTECYGLRQNSWLQIQRFRVLFPALLDLLERGPFRLVMISEGLLEIKSSDSSLEKLRLTTVRICCANHGTLYTRKGFTNFAGRGSLSAVIFAYGMKVSEFVFVGLFRGLILTASILPRAPVESSSGDCSDRFWDEIQASRLYM